MLAPHAAVSSPTPARVTVRREPVYLGGERDGLFARLHSGIGAEARDAVAVLCPPLGYEYVHSHRSVRHLADALARQGIQALRFDYHGTGDSPGTDLDDDRLPRWLADVRLAVSEARRLSGGARVCLLGIRLGATLAALVAAEVEVDWLVLWNPSAAGRRYVREQQAVAAQASQPAGEEGADAPLQAAGFMLTAQTQAALKAVNLLSVAPRAGRGVLLLQRDDLGIDDSLRAHLASNGSAVDAVACSGLVEMLAEPLQAEVPLMAIDATVRWLVARSDTRTPPQAAELGEARTAYSFAAADGRLVDLLDTACQFGVDDHLFGIRTEPREILSELPTVVMFSAGVVHRVGPNRLYTQLARQLAAQGFPCVRCDIEGIGDSVLRAPGRESHPYPPTALDDAEHVLEGLAEHFGAREFIVMGLCSGAYTSFLAGVSESAYLIRELVLLNPLTFHWTEGDTLATDHFREVAYYRGSMRSASSWKKLLRGQVDMRNVAKVLKSHLVKQVKSRVASLLERVYPQAGSTLSNRLRKLFARRRHVSLFVASGDPGWDILTADARKMAYQGLKRGNLSVQFIADADHTFTNAAARRRLVEVLGEHLRQRYAAAPPPARTR